MSDELDREHPPMAPASDDGKTPPPLAGHSPGCGPEHGLRAGTGGTAPPARATRPDRATRFIETARGVLAYSELAPLLAERVLRLEAVDNADWQPIADLLDEEGDLEETPTKEN